MEAGVAERVERRMPVCVTSGVSYIGWAIADRLMRRGYTVRLVVETGDDLAMLGETGAFEGTEASRIFPVVANMMEMSSLCEAFDGCAGVFHTSAFLDTAGISGYTKHMAEKEASVAGKVVEACVLTSSVRTCVFTSSLLACIWRQYPGLARRSVSTLVDESCWSDENLCTDKKLWLALGKTMAEKAVWRAARGKDLKLATLCPALITGPGFCARNPTSTIAYLKGGREMYAEGLLATTDVSRVAEAHVRVYEAMGGSAAGRYICFDTSCAANAMPRNSAEAGLAEHLSIIEGGSDVAPHSSCRTTSSADCCQVGTASSRT
ncbi:unnamed protein product [Spirodela intermedia]|uniref:3-beta hydroxysteroid dehydrogenase/isomerase domain-containing protein n=1 Tax=Spirodela intermedia TaxID=51605 RepID=A0A7I8JNW0_SPIIN|nr:unnamed protein product [Spirodela intermedia]CAA6671455.1 unnamed protein product [Spirodela intermedia]